MKKIIVLLILMAIKAPLFSKTIFPDNFNRNDIGSSRSICYGKWSIDNNMLKHTGDGTFNSDFIICNQSINEPNYQISCRMLWQEDGFFEDGLSCFHKVLDMQSANAEGRHDNFLTAHLSDHYGNKARLYKYGPTAEEYEWTDHSCPDLETEATTNQWVDLKPEITKTDVNHGQIKFFVDNKPVILFSGHLNSLLSDLVGLGGGKGQYHQIVYFDDFIISGPEGPTSFIHEVLPIEADVICYPNPFKEFTVIEWSAEQTEPVHIEVYNAEWILVSNIHIPYTVKGKNRITWDRCNDEGKRLNHGHYFYQPGNSSFNTSRKMVLIK